MLFRSTRRPRRAAWFLHLLSLWEGREGRQRTESNGGKTGISTLPSAPPAIPAPPISTGTALIQDQPGQRLRPVQSLSRLQLFATPWTAARQASLSITNSGSLLKLMSIQSVMLPNYLIFCRSLLLPPSIFPSIRVFSNESVLHNRWTELQLQLQHQSFQ